MEEMEESPGSIYEMETLYLTSGENELHSELKLIELQHEYEMHKKERSVPQCAMVLTKIAECQYELGSLEEAIATSNKSINLYHYWPNTKWEIKSLLVKVRSLLSLGSLEEAFHPVILAHNYACILEGADRWTYMRETDIERLKYSELVNDLEEIEKIKTRTATLNEVLGRGEI